MKRLPSNFDWLLISIARRPANPGQLSLLLSFQNQSLTPATLPFSNATCKAELFGLMIYDRHKCRIEPQRKVHVRPMNDDEELHLIPPQGHWNYFLKGEINKNTLDFPGAIYKLQIGQSYRLSFQYQGVYSNEISWVVPNAATITSRRGTTKVVRLGLDTDSS